LSSDEERKVKEEYVKVKSKFQSDINLVKEKLAEEKAEKKEIGGWARTSYWRQGQLRWRSRWSFEERRIGAQLVVLAQRQLRRK
jgi:hypothetical protein